MPALVDLFVLWQRIAHAPHASLCPQTLMDVGRTGAYLAAISPKEPLTWDKRERWREQKWFQYFDCTQHRRRKHLMEPAG